MEVAFSETAIKTTKQFSTSWSNVWADELDRRIRFHNIKDLNAIVMMVVDRASGREPFRQIPKPVSVSSEGYELIYLGEIEHERCDQ